MTVPDIQTGYISGDNIPSDISRSDYAWNKDKGSVTKVKICGLRTKSDIAAVNAAVPDYAGFIFDPTRRRYIPPREARSLCRLLDSRITPVAVFVNAPSDQVLETVSLCGIRVVQLHGTESEDYIAYLRQQMPVLKIIKAFSAMRPEDLSGPLKCSADLVLIDHGAGGTGESFDWSILNGFDRPYILAGGLHPENVKQALRRSRPYAVDVSSGVETEGRKDEKKILCFVQAVRSMN